MANQTGASELCWYTYLEAFGDDAWLAALASRKVMVQRVDEPCPELQGICLLLNCEALVAAAHHSLHELMGTDLDQPAYVLQCTYTILHTYTIYTHTLNAIHEYTKYASDFIKFSIH